MAAAPPIIERLASIDSTSAEARRRVLDGRAVDGLALVADEQTDGRGRRGTRWVMQPGRSLAFTLVRPQPRELHAAALMAQLAVATCRGLEAAGASPLRIKWPNDILRDDRKIAGLLVDAVSDAAGRDWLLVGLGVNLGPGPPAEHGTPSDLPPHAGHAGLPPTTDREARALAQLLTEYDAVLGADSPATQAERGAEYVRRAWIVGRQVTVEHRGQRQVTRVASVSPAGDLTTADGQRLRAEHVHLVDVEGLG